MIENFFRAYNLKVKVLSLEKGKVFDTYKIRLGATRLSSLLHLARELSLYICGYPTFRVVPQEGIVEIIIPHKDTPTLFFDKKLLSKFKNHELPILLGESNDGPFALDLVKAPHILIAGTTGSGKTNVNCCIIESVIEKADVLVIDLKRIDYPYWDNLYRVRALSSGEASSLLSFVLDEVIPFHLKLLEVTSCRTWSELQKKIVTKRVVIVIDECAELFLEDKDIEEKVCRIAQIGRAAGIHIIIATQRPSYDVITGRIKANFPLRIALKTASSIDSKVVGVPGAEYLRGHGDMLVGDIRLQGYFFQTVNDFRVIHKL